jgi:DNA modification methylase
LRAEVCRIPYVDAADLLKTQQKNPGKNPHNTHGPTKIYGGGRTAQTINAAGRWPANVVLDEAAAAMLESQVPGASRFFWCAKVRGAAHAENTHPTVKPVDLMRWLVRLVVAPGELVLDPFTGSGSTGVAALAEGARFVGVEREHVYVALARGRLVAAGGREQVMRRAVVRRITK